MILDRNENKPVVVLLGAGSMGTAIVRRIAAGKTILLIDGGVIAALKSGKFDLRVQ